MITKIFKAFLLIVAISSSFVLFTSMTTNTQNPATETKEAATTYYTLDKLPLNIAVFGGFTSMNTTYSIDKSNNQEVAFKLNAFTIQTIASLDFPFVTVYGAIGYDKGSSTLKLKGTYNLEYTLEGSNTTIQESVTNPINMDFDANGARGTLGLRFNLGFFKIYGDYTIKEYNTVSAGVAFSFR